MPRLQEIKKLTMERLGADPPKPDACVAGAVEQEVPERQMAWKKTGRSARGQGREVLRHHLQGRRRCPA